jgi:putative peptidoglycan lipid II flippase
MQMAALRSSTLLKATTIISAALLISRIFGLLRTTLFAAVLGYGSTTDAYTLAFTLPDAIFNIVSGGALASAIIPVFNDYMVRRKDRATGWKVASMALNTSMIALVGLCFIAIIFTEPVMRLFYGNGFLGVNIFADSGCTSGCFGPLAVDLTRIMLLQPIFLGGATVAIALLQARQSFVAPAIGQVVYTLTVVGGIGATALDKSTHIFGGNLGIYGPTWGVVIGAILQLLVQIPALIRAKMQYTSAVSFTDPGIIEITRLMGPRIINSAVLYTSTFVSRFLLLAVGIATGVLTGYNTAFTLIQLPNGLIGMALAQAAFPTLSTLASARQWDRLRDNVLRSIKAIAYLTIPATIGLIVFASPITRLVVDYGAFKTSDLFTVEQPLIAFAVGLTGLSLVEILTRSFYALENTRTPTQISILQFMFDMGMSVLMAAWGFGAWGIALASSIAWTGEALVLLIMLRQELAGLDLKDLGLFMLKSLAGATLAVGVAALFYVASGHVLVPQLINGEAVHSKSETLKFVVRMLFSVAVCGGAYFWVARFLKIDDVLPLNRILSRVTARFKR